MIHFHSDSSTGVLFFQMYYYLYWEGEQTLVAPNPKDAIIPP